MDSKWSDPARYTIGWICAIPVEHVASSAMLDQKHPRLRYQHKDDNNSYTLGQIGQHYVAITCLPEYGTNAAASTVKSMQHTFCNLRFSLMVGIGGGIPSKKNDIRLGDIVVGLPTDTEPGVVQYDLGRMETSGFVRKGSLNRPPKLLISAVTSLRSLGENPEVAQEIADKIKNSFKEREESDEVWTYPIAEKDILYRDDHEYYAKKFGIVSLLPASLIMFYYRTISTLGRFSITAGIMAILYFAVLSIARRFSKVHRAPRRRLYPKIHYGNIGSGNSVVKNGVERDALAKRYNVICLEMEAAGLMNDIQCLVIRGISDYADSRKNDKWKCYAASTAAAYAWKLLSTVPLEQLHVLVRVNDSILYDLSEMHREQKHRNITKWLTRLDYTHRHSDILSKRHEGSGEWLLQSRAFKQWLEKNGIHTLFCPGKPGAGKTVITSIVIDELHHIHRNDRTVGIAYLYCDFRRKHEQKPLDLFLSLLEQLVQQQHQVMGKVKDLFNKHKLKRTRPTLDETFKVLREIIIKTFERTFIIVDAIDECQASNEGRKPFLSLLFNLQDDTSFSLFVTSRFIPNVMKEFERRKETTFQFIRADEEDMQRYLDTHISRLPVFVQSSHRLLGFRDKIKKVITQQADGIFLLAALYLDALEDKVNFSLINHTLDTLPRGLDAYKMAYDESMNRIAGQRKGFHDLAMEALSWITCAKDRLTRRELQHALAIQEDKSALDKDNITDPQLIISVCAGLLTHDEKSDIVEFAHHTTQEYFEKNWKTWFRDAQANIARKCITYLFYEAFSTGYCETDTDLNERSEQYPLYKYASRNWGHHAKKSSDEKTGSLILKFLECENKVSACGQQMLAGDDQDSNYSKFAPKKMTGLHLAACFSLTESIEKLLKRKYPLNSKDGNGGTTLHWASRYGNEAVVKLLLDKDVDPETPDTYLCTPLHWASKYGNKTAANLLIERKKANINALDKDSGTPLHLASENGHEAIVKLLLEKGADLEALDSDDSTPLHRASENGYHEVVKLLLHKKVDKERRDRFDRTPLYLASENGHEAVVGLLLGEGTYQETHDRFRRTPLHLASENGHEAVVKLLLEKGADLEALDSDDGTPLHRASENGHEEIVKLLLKERANKQARDKNAQTPRDRASVYGHDTIMKLLSR